MRIRRVLAASAAAALLVGTGATMAFGAGDHTVRKADFIGGLSDTRNDGYFGFGPKGLVLDTTSSTGQAKVAEYYGATGALPDSGSQDWTGSQPEPGKQIVFNSGVSGDSGYNILVGEPAYDDAHNGAIDGDDWWMSTGSYIYKNHHNTQTHTDPTTQQQVPNGDDELCPRTDGGSGSNCHGTLAEWKAKFPNAAVSAYGFSLGSGVKGDGVLKSQTFGTDKYTFSDAPADVTPPPAVTPEKHTKQAAVTAKGVQYTKRNREFAATLSTNACPADDTCRGTKVRWIITIDGKSLRYNATAGWGDSAYFRQVFSKAGGDRHVKVTANGKTVLETNVTTN